MTDYFAHESSFVDEGAEVGTGTKIWHFSHLMAGAKVGDDCNIGQNVFIGSDVVIGDHVKIQNNVSVYTGVTVEDYAFLGPSMVFTNVVNPRSHVSRRNEYQQTLVKRGASIGANATIVCGMMVGRYSFVGAGAVITKDIPDYALVYGNPGRLRGWVCQCGTKLIFGPEDDQKVAECGSCGTRYSKEGPKVSRVRRIMTIPLVDLKAQYRAIQSEIDGAIQQVLESGHFVLGPNVQELEQEVAAYLGVKHAIGVASGTDALIIALESLGIGAGDEVIVPSYTFFATAEAVLQVGARPVFVDIEPDTYCLDVQQVTEQLTPSTKAVIPVHMYGHPASMGPLLELAGTHGLKVIEDNAQAMGAEYDGRKTGSLGDAGCLSFFPSKNLGAYGDGGMVVTNDAETYERARMLRTHGWREKYFPETTGHNSRLDELQAAILRVKLNYLDVWNQRRREVAAQYKEQLSDLGIGVPYEASSVKHVFHLFVVRLRQRDEVIQILREKGIGSAIYYPQPLHLTKPCQFLGLKEGDLAVTEQMSRETLAIPVYPEMSDQQVQEVVAALEGAMVGF